jgi:TolB protein
VRVDADGSEEILSKGINPAVSPDGKWIVFSMPIGRSWHLFMVRPDGSDLTQLTNERCADVQPAWSADGKWIVFTSNRGQVDLRTPSKNNWDIWAINREGSSLIRLTEDEARDGAPTVAPNGKVYFHSDRKIDRQLQEDRQVKGRSGGFHIWSVQLPKEG